MTAKNVFSELGLANDTATAEAWRSDFARLIRESFSRSQMSQVAFAKRIGVKQSVVSRIINGRIASLSVEFLLKIAVRLETRGIATWGPSPDEARVTSDVASITGTVTSKMEIKTLNVADEPVRLVPTKPVTSKKSATSSQHKTIQVH
jgi:predicted XRE-type DNA-binding protein